ncbi:unnamed protein product [Darwinula stevensoni]|uniref:Uncharacterized protein n=1 Tax=Darwinula stevensoni TaxID=69355 RepID=A0A7R8XD81_9CRUS|nr:unnamed protein product [Darwinula stevensoni]CAG0886536.1 unnamed protein product [Darwinula stevensoni]
MGMASSWAIWIASVITWVASETSSVEEMERESGRQVSREGEEEEGEEPGQASQPVKILSRSDLEKNMEKNKNKLILLHIYSHTKKGEVENMERRIVEKISHAIFLDADLDEDWTMDFFWTKEGKKRSKYFLVVFSPTKVDFDAIHSLFSQWGITPLGYTQMGPSGPIWGVPEWVHHTVVYGIRVK